MTDQETPPSDKSERNLNALGGAALGALIALILALSNTAVASATLSVLVGGAIVFLALQDNILPNRAGAMTKAMLYRIIGFSVAAILALLIGLHIRATNALGEGEAERMYNDLVKIGITEEDARAAVLARVAGTKNTDVTETERLLGQSTLFSGAATKPACDDLAPGKFDTVESVIARYTVEGGVWAEIAKRVTAEHQADSNLNAMAFVKGMHAVNCDGAI